MLLRPSSNDLRIIGQDLGRILGVVAAAGLLPLGWAVARSEWRPAGHLLLMVGVALSIAGAAEFLAPERKRAVCC